MSYLEGLSPGKDVGFQLDVDGEKFMFAGKVCEMDDRNLSIEINDEDLKKKRIFKGMTARLFGQHKQNEISLPVRIENAETLPILQIREQNSRSFFRVDGFIRLKYVRIVGEDYARIREQYLNKIGTEYDMELFDSDPSGFSENDTNMNAISVNFLNQISMLNKKLYFLQELMINSKETDLFDQNPVKVNISGSGMKFKSSDCFKVGDLLDMKMVLPSSPFYIIKTVALVIRIDELPEQKSSLKQDFNCIAVKFIAINEDDREALIRCISILQRKMLRRKRMTH